MGGVGGIKSDQPPLQEVAFVPDVSLAEPADAFV